MKVLGLDLGSRATGYALLEARPDGPVLVDSGVMRPKGADFEKRMLEVARGVDALLERLSPEAVAIEKPVYVRNPRVAIQLSALYGAVYSRCVYAGFPVFAYEPSTVKKAVTSSGAASKEQVIRLVRAVFGETLPQDAADAAACALCHLHRAPLE